jgi:hypothetical protein
MNKDSLTTALARFVTEAKHLLEETHEAEDRHIYEMYLAHAGVILDRIVQDQAIGNDIDTMERLFGHTWLKDTIAYAKEYATWDEFKRLLTDSIHGMTVNERLYTLGLIEEFDNAIKQKDNAKLRAVLTK